MAERPLRFERRMSDAEALMWTIEKDPAMRSSFLQLTLLDSPPDFARFRRRMERAVKVLPRLGQRVVPPPFRFAPPEWADDPSFDIDFHVRRLAVPPPGTERQLLDLAALIYEDAFDRARPLWQLTIVEGLEGNRAALLAKMHHTITDGVGGVRLSMQFLDLAPDAPDPDDVVEEPVSAPERGAYDVLSDAVGHNVRRQLGVVQRGAAGTAGLAVHPDRSVRLASDLAATAASLWRQLAVVQPSRSPLWTGRRSLTRRFETLSVNLDEVKRAAKGLGGTVNDLFVAALAGGAAAYHRAKGADVDELRMTMPVNIRDDKSAGGNAFSPARLLVPAGLHDSAVRFTAIHERLNVAKNERALGLFGSLAGVMNRLPTSLLTRVARQQAETVDFAASNVKAADFDLYIAGAHIEGNHPMGPTAGTAFNATVMSYKNRFDVGLNIDTAAIDDPELLRTSIEESFAELLKVGTD
ncbi:MAG TPA: wax ester/triacylglycerol synthase family O-acyltransferase [Acidimicrobiales bacterium]|jgi:WS/DGAT/MGAT family acyltransferase|nr:wax ester/triacylglycerol synthase family O-acyltransferase [Acidimicrobiales bacterium]